MRTWNKAFLCLAALSLQAHAAFPIVQLKSGNDAVYKSQAISDLSVEENRELFEQMIIEAEMNRDAEDSDEP
ncbi:MAG: hypothetical protein AB7H97_21365, partial [Pseudobdellovibrionaceae bacterium]